MIEYTMYVTRRDEGTRPYRRTSAQEFHESQWTSILSHRGRLIQERSIDPDDLSHQSEIRTRPSTSNPSNDFVNGRLNNYGMKLRQIVQKIRSPPATSTCHGMLRWQSAQPRMNATSSSRETLEYGSAPQVNEWEIPNANFARKFGLFTDNLPLPPCLKELPIAEEKATNAAFGSSLRDIKTSRRYQGPFTPQLWFDSGLDYWRVQI